MLSESLQGKTIVVTGASDGIGRACVRALAAVGAHVVMVGRNEAKTAAAASAIMSEIGRRTVTWEIADLARQDAVRELAERLSARTPEVHALINNAGALFLERELTAEGLERTFALNHLQYFTLSLLLLPQLLSAHRPGAPARVINVSSRAHMDARLDLDDLQMTRGYNGVRAYANSKLGNVLFTQAFAQRVDASRIVTHAVHPGVVSTRFATNNGRRGRLLRWIMDLVSVSPERGADTIAWLTSAPEALTNNGGYWVKRCRVTPSTAARNTDSADQLWRVSAALAQLDADGLIAAAGLAPVT